MKNLQKILQFTDSGIYIPVAECYIDPWQPVGRAIITHAHSDHARSGHGAYLSHHHSASVLKQRLGQSLPLRTAGYEETIHINGVRISLHPAGHIIGSAQVRIEYQGTVAVVSGDYKTQADPTCPAFEPLPCHAFVTESTFGLPVYRWRTEDEIMGEINKWWAANRAEGKCSIIYAYALGKAQRLLSGLDYGIGPVFVHGAVWNVLEALSHIYQPAGPVEKVQAGQPSHLFQGAMVVAPPSAMGSTWLRKFQPYTDAVASGWMSIRGMRRRRAVDTGFVLSDHADWPGLCQTIADTGAEKIFVTHGYADLFSRFLSEQGLDAQPVSTRFEGEMAEATPVIAEADISAETSETTEHSDGEN